MKVFHLLYMAGLLVACNSGAKPKEVEKPKTTANEKMVQLTDAQMKNAGIEMGKLEKKDISEILKLNGSIDVPPQNIVSVSVPLGGYLKSTQLLPGMHI